jgi:broad specificity phosphatase PhoE
MPTTRFILVRHGETLANREFRYIGTSDHALSEHGQVQAKRLAEALSVLSIAAVYSSPLQRAYHTAEPIAEQHGLPLQVLPALRESSFGEWEGLNRAEVLARSEQDAYLLRTWELDTTIAPPGGESFAEVRARACAALELLACKHLNETVVLVSHVGVIKVLLCVALAAPLNSLFHLFLDPATISVIDWRLPRPFVRLVNSHAHLGWDQARWMQI